MGLRHYIRSWLYADQKVVACSDNNEYLREDESTLGCRLFSANNGHVLEFIKHQKTTDRSHITRYIIDKNNPNVAETIGKFFALELMR